MADDDTATILELYKTAVEMADNVSARRAGANSFFLTLNTALTAVVGIVSSARKPPPHGNLPTFDAFGLVLTAIAKWDVINTLEKRLPVQPFTDEWAILHPAAPPGEPKPTRWIRCWRREVKHREATVVEQVVPLVFVAIYVALAVRMMVQ
jgi:hypothetical protein